MLVLRGFTTTTTQLFRRAAFGGYARGSSISAAAAPSTGTTGAVAESNSSETSETTKKPKNSIVEAAFKSLSDNSEEGGATTSPTVQLKTAYKPPDVSNIDERIINAKTVNGLLAVTEANGAITRKHALKIVSILAEWSSINRIKTADFENDSRFLRICRVLGRTVTRNNNNNANESNGAKRISGFRTDDLNTVLGVAGDDEAAKLIASISLPQMVKVMSTLALRKRRSTPLLRSLAFNISSSTEKLDLKQCGDVLYAMASLNFPDSVLAAKICSDIQEELPKNINKSAVIGSILTSLGILRYRDLDMLESLTQWALKHSDICRPQDVSALLYTSAVLNFQSSNIDDIRKKLVKTIVREDFTKPTDWLNHVWSVALLGLVESNHLETVLSTDFIHQIETSKTGLSPTYKMKLLNLNSVAKLLTKDYTGPTLSADSTVFNVPMAHSKSKQVLLNGVLDALKSLLPASNHVHHFVDSKMGFPIDALCMFDVKRNPLPLDKEHPNGIKIALMIVDFHDICHGPQRAVSGQIKLSFDLLERTGYKVLPVPYNEFNISDKLLKRVQYLESKFKAVVSSSKN